jgi:lactate dehydrogenase-like 2-hydroxyacid dehydrogenase
MARGRHYSEIPTAVTVNIYDNPNATSTARPRVFVMRRLPEPIETQLRERYEVTINSSDEAISTTAIVDAARRFDAIVSSVADDVPEPVFSVTPRRLRIVANFGVGFDRIDIDAARAHGIVVTNTPGALTEDTADIAILLLLAAARRASEAERELRAGRWTGWRPTHMLGTRMNGAVLGIVGFGRIGAAVARRAYRGFGMRVLFVNPSTPDASAVADADATRCESLEEVLPQCDFVSLHAPSRPETRRLLDRRRLALMRTGAILVNTARGDLVDEAALADALARGQIAAAGLDVYENEPRVSDQLLALDNVVLLPHIGSATTATRVAMGERMLENLDSFLRGNAPPDRVV